MVESCSTLPSLFVFCVFAKCQIGTLPFYPNDVPARESHPGVASLKSSQSHISFGRSFNFEDVLSLWLNLGKQKEPITQSIRNRREHGSRFKMMFYVIGSEDQSRVLLHTAPANRTKGVVEQFGTSGVPIPCRMKPTYGGTFVFSCLCSESPLYHHYTDTSLIRQVSDCLSLYSEFQRAIFNGVRKRSLYWLGHLGTIYQRVLGKILKNALK